MNAPKHSLVQKEHPFIWIQPRYKLKNWEQVNQVNSEITPEGFEVLLCSFDKVCEILKIDKNTPISELEDILRKSAPKQKSDLDLYILQEVFHVLSLWYDQTPLSINLFPESFLDKRIYDILEKNKQLASKIHLEVLEYWYTEQPPIKLVENIKKIQKLWYKVGLDDYPCWFNDDELLKTKGLALDFIKIDKQFAVKWDTKSVIKCINKILVTDFSGEIIIEWIETEVFCKILQIKIQNKIKYLEGKLKAKELEEYQNKMYSITRKNPEKKEIQQELDIQKSIHDTKRKIENLKNITLQWYFFAKKAPIQLVQELVSSTSENVENICTRA